jgi:transcriptional regulator with XRE-family HTH domain
MKLRIAARLSRADIAHQLEMDSSRIAGIEQGRVPIKYEAACTLLGFFAGGKINPLWLATGEEPMLLPGFYGFQMPSAEAIGFRDRDYFSTVIDTWKDRIASLVKPAEEWNLPRPWLSAQREYVRWRLEGLCQEVAGWQGVATTLDAKLGTLDFSEEDLARMPEGEKLLLTNLPTSGNLVDVKSVLPELRVRLKKATEPRGKRSELARFLGAPLSSVSRWLSGKHKPGGNTALMLLNWVERQERDQIQRSGGVKARPEPPTRKRKGQR